MSRMLFVSTGALATVCVFAARGSANEVPRIAISAATFIQTVREVARPPNLPLEAKLSAAVRAVSPNRQEEPAVVAGLAQNVFGASSSASLIAQLIDLHKAVYGDESSRASVSQLVRRQGLNDGGGLQDATPIEVTKIDAMAKEAADRYQKAMSAADAELCLAIVTAALTSGVAVAASGLGQSPWADGVSSRTGVSPVRPPVARPDAGTPGIPVIPRPLGNGPLEASPVRVAAQINLVLAGQLPSALKTELSSRRIAVLAVITDSWNKRLPLLPALKTYLSANHLVANTSPGVVLAMATVDAYRQALDELRSAVGTSLQSKPTQAMTPSLQAANRTCAALWALRQVAALVSR